MKCYFSFISLFVLLASSSLFAKQHAVNTPEGEVIYFGVPENELQGERRYYPDLILFKPKKRLTNGLPDGETPASMACIYGLTSPVPGCRKDIASSLPTGGWGAIALVDAGDNPFAESDLAVFNAQFGLPACTTANGCFHKVFASGVQPPEFSDWVNEIALDTQWAHAMAPYAKIYLVEAASDSESDLFFANDVASALVQAEGGGEVSNSWSRPEFPTETSMDIHFQTPGIVYFGSSGDYSKGARYPSASPYVVSAGGTTIIRDSQGNFIEETAWNRDPGIPQGEKNGGSGGPSIYESRPSYQNMVQKIVNGSRGTPDISFNANRSSGVLVYSTFAGGWRLGSGTSVSAPSLAGIVNSANRRASSTMEELSFIYTNALKHYRSYWRDITSGNNGYPCLPGYDLVTGLGSPISYQGK